MDEREAAAAVARGDRDAFRLLVERESASVVRTCQRILGRADEAEDAAQEAFVTAFRAIRTYRGDGPFGAWVSRIAARQALRILRRRPPTQPIDPTGAMDPADQRPDPLGEAVSAERAAELRAAVAMLPDPYRETVALRFFSECSLNEIATVTGRPLPTVKTHLRRGLERLRAQVEDQR